VLLFNNFQYCLVNVCGLLFNALHTGKDESLCQETDQWQQGIPFPGMKTGPLGSPWRRPHFMQWATCQRANGGRSDDIMWICKSTNRQTAQPMSELGLMFYIDRLTNEK